MVSRMSRVSDWPQGLEPGPFGIGQVGGIGLRLHKLQPISPRRSSSFLSFQTVSEAQLLPKPGQSPSIPIWVAGYWPHHKPLQRAARFDGIYIGTQTASGEPLTPRDLQEAFAYITSQRTTTSPFDVAFAGETPADVERGRAIVRPFVSAGVTWWLEGIWPERGSLEQMRERIRQGPPRPSAAPPLAQVSLQGGTAY
jgi:alkanesulfonate monooxygenase SsuD/methylene tetrahydromethanopterin reductase-like flavin-dependent oxidoreductase (luciferase family)